MTCPESGREEIKGCLKAGSRRGERPGVRTRGEGRPPSDENGRPALSLRSLSTGLNGNTGCIIASIFSERYRGFSVGSDLKVLVRRDGGRRGL